MTLKYRERQILKILLQRESVTGNEFSDIFNMSSRTIRNDIKNINLVLKEKGVEISSTTNIGYFLTLTEEKRSMLMQLLAKETDAYKAEPKYRIKKLIQKLIQFDSIDLSEFANEFYVSQSLVLQDVKSLKHQLFVNSLNLVFVRQVNQITIAKNTETNIRSGLALLLVGDFNDLDKTILTDMEDFGIQYRSLYQVVVRSLNLTRSVLAEHDIIYLTTYLYVTLVRIRRKHELNVTISEEIDANPAVNTLLNELERMFAVHFSDFERYIVHRVYSSFSSDGKPTPKTTEIYRDVQTICKNIDQIYGTRFANDQQLVDGVVSHLYTTMNRAELNINFTDEIVKEIRSAYPFAFNLSTYFVNEVTKTKSCHDYSADENEIAFVSIHIQASLERNMMTRKLNTVIIGSYGIGTTKLLEAQIKNEFPNLEIQATVAYYAAELMDFNDIDLVISTVPITVSKSIPCITVEVPIKPESMQAIKRVLQSKYFWSREIYPIILELPEDIREERDALRFIEASIQRIESKVVPLCSSFEAREKSLTTNIGRGIAMPHALFEERFDYHLYFFHSRLGIQWGPSSVNLIATILITSEVKEYMNEYMKLIHSIYSNLDVRSTELTSITKLYETMGKS